MIPAQPMGPSRINRQLMKKLLEEKRKIEESPVMQTILIISLIGFAAGVIGTIIYSVISSEKMEKSMSESEERFVKNNAQCLKAQYEGKIAQGTFLVVTQDVDLGIIMSERDTEHTRSFTNFREALIDASGTDIDDEMQVFILDDLAEIIVYSFYNKFCLRIPKKEKGRETGSFTDN